MNKILHFIIASILSLTFICCSNHVNSYYHSKLELQYKLVKIDSLIFENTPSLYLGAIGKVYPWKKFILIQDMVKCNIAVFNFKLEYLFSVGKKGRGPGEYTIPPFIVQSNDTGEIFLLDVPAKKIDKYDNNFKLISEYSLPDNFYYSPFSSLKTKNTFIFSAIFPFPINNDEYFKKYKALISVNGNYKYQKNFLSWDEIYLNSKYDAYTRNNISVNLCTGRSDEFYAQQKSSFIIHIFNKNLKLVKSFGILPKYFIKPPTDISASQTQINLESFFNFESKTTAFRNIYYDIKESRVYIGYLKHSKRAFYDKNAMENLFYLQVYGKNYNCIYDNRIPGKFLFARDGKIYILNAENEKYFKINVYKLIINK